jgi:hypothetical protein
MISPSAPSHQQRDGAVIWWSSLRLHRTAFAQDDAGAARLQLRKVADRLRSLIPKLATLMNAVTRRQLCDRGHDAGLVARPLPLWRLLGMLPGSER